MNIYTLKAMRHDRLGPIAKHTVVDMPEPWASKYVAMGAAEFYDTKVVRDTPLPLAGQVEQSSSLPADQVLQNKTSQPSGTGVKRKKKEA